MQTCFVHQVSASAHGDFEAVSDASEHMGCQQAGRRPASGVGGQEAGSRVGGRRARPASRVGGRGAGSASKHRSVASKHRSDGPMPASRSDASKQASTVGCQLSARCQQAGSDANKQGPMPAGKAGCQQASRHA